MKHSVTCKVEYEFRPDCQLRGVVIVYAWFGEKLIRLGWVSKSKTSEADGFPIPTDAIEFARDFLSEKARHEIIDPDMEITRVDIHKSNPSWPIQ
jgi:hypothetical protein